MSLPPRPVRQCPNNVQAGTYLAETRAPDKVDLISATTPLYHSALGRPRRKAADYHQKCTILPALTSLGPLLDANPGPQEQTATDWKETPVLLPPLPQTPATTRRLYPGPPRRGPVTPRPAHKEATSTVPFNAILPAPSEDEFLSWLRTPRADASHHRAHGHASDQAEATWYVFLLRSTFENFINSPAKVASDIANVLGIKNPQARAKVEVARSRPLSLLCSCRDHHEASATAESLRSFGLVVQLCSKAGVPRNLHVQPQSEADSAEDSDTGHQRRGFKVLRNSLLVNAQQISKAQEGFRDYPKLFRTVLESPGPKRTPQPSAASYKENSSWRWRTERVLKTITVLPEAEESIKAMVQAASAAEALRRAPTDDLADTQDHFDPGPRRRVALMQDEIMQSMPAGRTAMRRSTAPDTTSQTLQSRIERHQHSSKSTPRKSELHAEQPTQSRLTPAKKEACEALRIMIFGAVGNEGLSSHKEKELWFQTLTMGSRKQAHQLLIAWNLMTKDGAILRADIPTVLTVATTLLKEHLEAFIGQEEDFDKIPQWFPIKSFEEIPKQVQGIQEKLLQVLGAKRGTISFEDLTKLLWPAAQSSDIRDIRRVGKETLEEAERQTVLPPKELPEEDLEGLKSVFRTIDVYGHGRLSLEQMVDDGFMVFDAASRRDFAFWDKDGDGYINETEFCGLMCPTGYRVDSKATYGTSEEGVPLCYDDGPRQCWMVAEWASVSMTSAIE